MKVSDHVCHDKSEQNNATHRHGPFSSNCTLIKVQRKWKLSWLLRIGSGPFRIIVCAIASAPPGMCFFVFSLYKPYRQTGFMDQPCDLFYTSENHSTFPTIRNDGTSVSLWTNRILIPPIDGLIFATETILISILR